MDANEKSIRTSKLPNKEDTEISLINSSKDPRNERTERIKQYFKAKEEFYKDYKYKKLLDTLMLQNSIIEKEERKHTMKPELQRKARLLASFTQRGKLGPSPLQQEQAADRLRSMECH